MSTSRRLLRLARRSRGWLALSVVLGLAATATYAGQGFAIARALARVLDGRGVGSIGVPVAIVMVLQAIRAVLLWTREVVGMRIGGSVRAELRGQLYAHLLELGPSHTAGVRTGASVTTLVDHVETVDPYFSRFLPQVAVSAVGAVVLLGIVAAIDPVVGSIVLACGLIVPLAPRISRRYWKRASVGWSALFRSLYANSLDAVQGMSTLKAFNAHARWGARLHAEGDEFNRASVRLLMASAISSGVVGLATSAGTALSVGVGALRLADGAMTRADLLLVLLLARECFRPLQELERSYHAAYAAPAAAQGIFDLLDTVPAVTSGPAAHREPGRGDTSVVFDGVRFGYPGSEVASLDGLSFHIDPGETVALVGRSGAGKTTAVALLLRFFDPDAGSIRVAGRDLRDYDLAELRSLIAVVAQDTYLFHGSVRDNLLLAKPDATDDELRTATTVARAHDFIAALPQGYDTLIGERGLRLSGGERQRLAIARAVLKDAPVLVLDEATSAIDGASEAAIQEALGAVTEGRTTLVVAHRLSTVRNADRIVVLDAGLPVEIGNPDDLLAGDGAYARLVAAQLTSQAAGQ